MFNPWGQVNSSSGLDTCTLVNLTSVGDLTVTMLRQMANLAFFSKEGSNSRPLALVVCSGVSQQLKRLSKDSVILESLPIVDPADNLCNYLLSIGGYPDVGVYEGNDLPLGTVLVLSTSVSPVTESSSQRSVDRVYASVAITYLSRHLDFSTGLFINEGFVQKIIWDVPEAFRTTPFLYAKNKAVYSRLELYP